jgi:Flp pilus assembly protein TadG
VRRRGAAAVEFAVCLPLVFLILAGVWEVGRIAEVSNVMWNAARESGRDASIGQSNLQAVATNMLAYLQGAEPKAFGQGHSTSLIAPAVSLPANTTGYTCWDNTANRELFTITFTDITSPSVTDPTGMQKLEQFQIGLQVPYASVGWAALPQITGMSRISVAVNWASMRDTPFQVSPALPAQ